MFIEINGRRLNLLTVQSVTTSTDGEYKIIYRFRNGSTKEEIFDTEAEMNNKLKEIQKAGGSGGGGSSTEGKQEVYVSCGIAEYDSTSTYSAGDIIFVKGTLYKCNEDIDTPGEFDPTKWTVSSLEEYYVTEPLSGSY